MMPGNEASFGFVSGKHINRVDEVRSLKCCSYVLERLEKKKVLIESIQLPVGKQQSGNRRHKKNSFLLLVLLLRMKY